jgi:hypothetical protein
VSPIAEWEAKAIRYGAAFLWYMAKMGMNTMSVMMREWVGPRCSIYGLNKRSISGMTESVRAKGMLSSVFNSLDDALLKRYPRARWPTANDLFSSRY